MKKRLISIVTSAMMMLSVVAIPTGVHATETTADSESGTVTVVNEMYEDVLDESDVEEAVEENMPAPNKVESSYYSTKLTYATDDNVVVNAMRSAMTTHEEVITVYYAFDDVPTKELLDSWVYRAAAETGNPKQGDYMMFHLGGASLEWDCDKEENGLYYYKMVIGFNYYTTAAQEAQVDAKVDEVLASLNLDGKSDYEKIKTIYNWVLDNAEFDTENEYDESYTLKYSAYAAMIDGKAVCQGFANTLYRLYNEAGISCRIVVNSRGTHSWNIIKLGDKYYNLDASSDTTTNLYGNFLTGLDTTVAEKYVTGEFAQNHPISSIDYFLTLLYGPEDLTVIREGNDATITWKAVDTAAGYVIYTKEDGGSYEMYGTTKNTSYTIVGDVDSSKDYMFKVAPYYVSDVSTFKYYDENLIYSEVSTTGIIPDNPPIEDGGETGEPEDGDGELDAVPTNPYNLIVTSVGYDSATLEWTSGKATEGFRVYYMGAEDMSYVLAGETFDTTYTVSGLKQGTDYTFAIEGYNGENITKKVESDPITTKRNLTAPTVTLSVDNDNVITVKWNAVEGAEGYKAYVKGGDYDTYTLFADNYTKTSITFEDVNSATEYSFKVTPYYYYDGKMSLGTTSNAVTIKSRTNLYAPTVSATAKSTSSIEATWNKVNGAEGYRVTVRKDGSTTDIVSKDVTGLSYTATGLAAGTKYTFKVTPYYTYNGSRVNSSYSGTVTRATASITLPKAPTGLKASLSSWSTVTVSWSAPANADKYEVYYKKSTDSSYTKAGATTSTSYKITLAQGTKYYFKVVPYNTVDGKDYKGTASDYVGITTKKNLAAPASVTVKLYGYNDVQIKWSKVAGAKGYYVYCKKASGSYIKLGSTTKTTYKKANLANGAKHTFKIVPYYTVGKTKFAGSKFRTASTYTLKKMKAPTAKKSGTNVKISYKTFAGANGYQIAKSKYKAKKYSVVKTVSGTKKSYGIVKAPKGKTYYYKVRMYKTVNGKKIYGNWSNPIKFKRK